MKDRYYGYSIKRFRMAVKDITHEMVACRKSLFA